MGATRVASRRLGGSMARLTATLHGDRVRIEQRIGELAR